ncbi:hypothetical protein BGZ65_000969, partial [Modicella reniformis]
TRQLNLPEDDPKLVSEDDVPLVPAFKEVIAQSYNDADDDDDDDYDDDYEDDDGDVDMMSVSRYKDDYE